MKYIQNTKGNDEDCIFCSALTKPDNFENLVIARGKVSFALLNLYPYTSGHMMVAPFSHKPNLDELTPQSRGEMMELVSQCIVVLKKVYQPQAFNVGANIGEAAGAGVPGHVHLHIVPRWTGDTNFMATVGEVRVLPKSIDQTYSRVLAAWQELYQ